jgi:hypothetical protein
MPNTIKTAKNFTSLVHERVLPYGIVLLALISFIATTQIIEAIQNPRTMHPTMK